MAVQFGQWETVTGNVFIIETAPGKFEINDAPKQGKQNIVAFLHVSGNTLVPH